MGLQTDGRTWDCLPSFPRTPVSSGGSRQGPLGGGPVGFSRVWPQRRKLKDTERPPGRALRPGLYANVFCAPSGALGSAVPRPWVLNRPHGLRPLAPILLQRVCVHVRQRQRDTRRGRGREREGGRLRDRERARRAPASAWNRACSLLSTANVCYKTTPTPTAHVETAAGRGGATWPRPPVVGADLGMEPAGPT